MNHACPHGCKTPGTSYRSGVACPGCTDTGPYRATNVHTQNELSAYLATLEISEGPTPDSSPLLQWTDAKSGDPLQELVSPELATWLRELKAKWNTGGYLPWAIYEVETTDLAMRVADLERERDYEHR